MHSPRRIQIDNGKVPFGVRQLDFLGGTISSDGVSPQTHKDLKVPKQIEILQIKKVYATLSGAYEILQKVHSQTG